MTSRHASAVQRRFEFHPSRILAATLAALHAAALVAVLSMPFPVWAKLAMVSMILTSLAYHAWCDAWLAAPSAAVALVLEAGEVKLVTRDGRQVVVTISHDSLVTSLLVVLNMKPQRARFWRRVVILPDSMDGESFRQLRVWLKWH
jgi:toxin CptA